MATEADEVAKKSVALIFQTGVEEAERTLNAFEGNATPALDCAMCYVKTVQCLLTFDLDVMNSADAFMKEVERRCAATTKSGQTAEKALRLKVIVADCGLLRALLAFARQSLTNYVRGGVLLRSASKAYSSVLAELSKQPSLSEELKAACSMGFGVVNVAVSLLPDKVMSLMKIVGFNGNRGLGLKSLEVAARSSDLRAPFALLLLLLYNVVTRPVLGIDTNSGLGSAAGEAAAILELSKTVCPDAALFIYFHGRLAFLKKDVSGALEYFSQAASRCDRQPEVRQLCQYEMAFVNVLLLKWADASNILAELCRNSPWSPGMYNFFSAIALASVGEAEESHAKFLSIPQLMKEKSSSLEKLVLHKVTAFTKRRLTAHTARVELLVMSYMSNYIRWCGDDMCEDIIEFLGENEKEVAGDVYFTSCSSLVCGAAYVQLEEADKAEVHLRRVLAHAKECVDSTDSHIPAHATLLLAHVYRMRGEIDKARNALEKTKSLYCDYELESQVQIRVKACLETLPS